MKSSKDKYLKKTALFLLKLAVSAVFVWFVFSRLDLSLLKSSLMEIRWLPAAIAFAVLACGGFAGAASWYNVIRANGLEAGYGRVAAMHWCGMFLNSFLPSNIGGDIYKGWMLVRERRSGVSPVAVSIIVDRVLNFSLLIMTGVVALAYSLAGIGPAAALVAGAALVFAALDMLARGWKEREGSGGFVRFIQALFCLFRSPRRCAAALVFAALSQGCKIGCHVFVIAALGVEIDASSVWYIIPLFGVVSALPVSFGGLGIRESVAMVISAPAGIVTEELVVLSLASHLLFILVNCLGFVPFLFLSCRSYREYSGSGTDRYQKTESAVAAADSDNYSDSARHESPERKHE